MAASAISTESGLRMKETPGHRANFIEESSSLICTTWIDGSCIEENLKVAFNLSG